MVVGGMDLKYYAILLSICFVHHIEGGVYQGCFKEEKRSRVFLISPGDYNPEDLTTEVCNTKCGVNYPYAAVTQGKFCFCGRSLPPNSALDESKCTMSCSGNATQMCGAKDYVSAFTSSTAIVGLAVKVNASTVSTGDAVSIIPTYLTAGANIKYKLNYGDGAGFTERNATNMWLRSFSLPGIYRITLSGNDAAESLVEKTALATLDVDKAVRNLTVDCPKYMATFEERSCKVKFLEGTFSKLVVTIDGVAETPVDNADPPLTYTGPAIPARGPVIAGENDPSKYIVMPSSEILRKGILTGFEMDVETTGNMKIYILTPSCTGGDKYCFDTNSCTSGTCSEPYESTCNGKYCAASKTCYDASNSKCFDPVSRYNGAQRTDFTIKYTIQHTVSKTGYQYWDLDLTQTNYEVDLGDVLAYKEITGGRLSSRFSTSTLTDLKSSDPTAKANAIALSSFKRHNLRAISSGGSGSEVFFNFKEIGTKNVKFSVQNSRIAEKEEYETSIIVLEGINNCIPNVAQCQAANKDFVLAMTPHTGSNVTYNWTMDNGEFVVNTTSTQYTYSSRGTYNLSVTCFNPSSSKENKTTVVVHDRISSFALVKDQCVVDENCPIRLSMTSGSDYSCNIEINKETKTVTWNQNPPNSDYVYIFRQKGTYDVKAVCTNCLGAASHQISILVEEKITNLRLVKPGALKGQSYRIEWQWDSGSDVQCSLMVDGVSISFSVLTVNKYASSDLQPAVHTTKDFSLNLTCTNKVSSALVITTFGIDEKIINPNVTTNFDTGSECTYIAKGDIYTFGASVEEGTRVNVTWDFDTSQSEYYSQPGTWPSNHIESKSFTFTRLGNYYVNVTIENAYSRRTFRFCQISLAKVENLIIVKPAANPEKIIFEPPGRIVVKIGQSTPSDVPNKAMIEINPGTVSQSSKTHEFQLNKEYVVDINDDGTHKITINVSNYVSFQTLQTDVQCIDNIRDIRISPDPLLCKVNSPCDINVGMLSGDVGITLEAQPFSYPKQTATRTENTVSHLDKIGTVTYTSVQNTTVTITAKSVLQTENKIFNVIAQHPVTESYTFTCGQPADWHATGGAMTCTFSYTGAPLPTSASMTIDFGDGSTVTTEPMSSKSFPHTYTTDGDYKTKFCISNMVSQSCREVRSGVYKSFVGLTAVAKYKPLIPLNSPDILGFGAANNEFPDDKCLRFHMSKSQGTHVYYEFQASNGVDLIFCNATDNPVFEICLNSTGTFNCSIKAKNPVYESAVTLVVIIAGSVKEFNISDDGNNTKAHVPKEFTLNFDNIDAQTCLVIEYGDGNTYMYGSSTTCASHASTGYQVTPLTNPFTVSHVYTAQATYTVKGKVFNKVSSVTKEYEHVISGIDCSLPRLSIKNIRPKFYEPLVLKKCLPARIVGITDISCGVFENTKRWTVEQVDENSGTFMKTVDVTSIPSATTAEIGLPIRFLNYGVYKVTYTMAMTIKDNVQANVTFESSISTYIKIVKCDLVAVISTVSSIQRGLGETVTLDPQSMSYDPDIDPKAEQTFSNFTWYCRNKNEEYPSTDQPSIPKTAATMVPYDNGGCWRDGPGRIDIKSGKLTFETNNMRVNNTYEIICKIAKDTRESEARIDIEIVPYNPPILGINLMDGTPCRRTASGMICSPSTRLALTSSCSGCPTGTTYLWSIYTFHPKWPWKPVDNQEEYVEEIKSPQIAILPSLFEVKNDTGTIFRINLQVSVPGGITGNVALNVSLNRPPYGGKCSIDPLVGYLSQTSFKLHCEGWSDDDGIKELKIFSQKKGVNTNTTLAFGSILPEEIKLPLGSEDDDYKMSVYCRAEDEYGASSEIFINQVQVKPISKTDVKAKLESYSSGENTELKLLIAKGDVTELANYAKEIAALTNTGSKNSLTDYGGSSPTNALMPFGNVSSSNAYSPINVDEKTEEVLQEQRESRSKVTEELSQALEALPVTSVTSIEAVTGAIYNLAESPDNINRKTQTNLMKTLLNHAKALKKFTTKDSDEEKIVSIETRRSVTERMIAGGLGILAAASFSKTYATKGDLEENEKEDYDTNLESQKEAIPAGMTDPEKAKKTFYASENKIKQKAVGKDIQEKFEEILSVCQQVMFDALVAGAPAENIDTPLMKAAFVKDNGEKLSNRQIDINGASVKLNSLTDMKIQELGDSNINIETIQSPLKLPDFNTDTTDHQIGTLTLTLYNDNNEEIPIKSLIKPISLIMPRHSNAPNPEAKYLEGFFPKRENFAYQYFEVPEDESLQVKMVPEDPKAQFLIVFKCDKFPNIAEGDVDFVCMVPHKMAQAGTSGSTSKEDPYTCLFDTQMRKRFNCNSNRLYIGYRQIEEHRKDFYTTKLAVGTTFSWTAFTTNFTLLGTRSKCQYYDKPTQLWKTDGCCVGPYTSNTHLHCLCTHLTTFTGGWVVAPNTIDWNFVFSNADFLKNPTLYVTEIVIVVVYLLVVVWARRQDKKDVEKLGLAPLVDNDKRDKYYYEIVIVTGMRRNAGTHSKINFILSGERDETEVRILSDSKRSTFRRGAVDGFLMAVPRPLGPLNYLHIWHDNSGKGGYASWYMRSMVVRDVQNDEKFIFICNRWFAVEEDDGLIDRIIPIAGKEQMTEFSHLFTEKTSKSLSDGHLWFSVVARPPQSRFTRVQRVSCCLCLLYVTMLSNAMFYEKQENDAQNSFTFGPFSLSPAQIYIGVICNLIVFPVNFLVIFIFRKSRPKSKRKSRVEEAITKSTCKPATSVTDINPILSSSNTGISSSMLLDGGKRPDTSFSRAYTSLSVADLAKETDESNEKKKKKKKLEFPWYFTIFGWIILWIATLVSAAFVTFYGIQFQDLKCKQWITSMLISFFMSVFITQPIKVFMTAIIFSLIIKNPGSDDEEEEEDEEKPKNLAQDEEYLHGEAYGITKPTKAGYKPPDSQLLEKAREIRLKEIKMWSVIREILFYTFFVWILMVISYQNRSEDMYFYKYSMTQRFIITNDTHHKFEKMKNVQEFWVWARTGLCNGIRAGEYYNNDKPLFLRGYINDKVSRIMGYATMRQVRVKRDTCRIADEMMQLIPECNAEYDISNSDDQDYGVGWTPKTGNITIDDDREEYRYTSAKDLNGYPYWGEMAVYGGGGYVVRLRDDRATLKAKMKQLESEGWIDKYTRAVFIEFTVYNPGVNLFAISTLLAEFRPSNGIFPSYRFEPAVLLPYMNGVMIFQLVCEGMYLLFTVYFLVREIRNIYRQKISYFKQFWNLVEFSLCVMSITAVVIYFYRLVVTNNLTSKFKESHGNEYMKFQYVGYWSEIFSYIIGWLVFFGTLKFLKLLRFNKKMSLLASTLKNSCKDLLHFSIIFNIVFLAFVQLFYLTYVANIKSFKTFVSSLESCVVMMMGKFEIYSMLAVDPIITQIFLFLYVVAVTFIVVNMLLSILNETFSAVRIDISKQNNDYEIVDFMMGRFKLWTGLGSPNPNVLKPEDIRMTKRETLEGKIDNFPDRIDRLLNSISHVYMEKERIDAIFDYNPEKKKGLPVTSASKQGHKYEDNRKGEEMTMVQTN